MPATRTTKVKGNYQGKVVFKHVKIKLIASNEPLMGCGLLPEWLRKKRCINALDTFDDNLCVWRCLALYKRKDVKRGAERSTKEALNLAREFYSDNKQKRKDEKEFRQYPHFIVHDWKAIQKPLNEQPTDDLTYIAKHVPISVAIYDTLSGEPVYLVDKNPEKLVEKFVDALSKKRDAIVKDVETKYPYPSDFVMLPQKVKENWKE